MKVFVTIGTQAPFDRLIKWMDTWAATKVDAVVVAQVTTSIYRPKYMKLVGLLTENDLLKYMTWADVVVGHAGIGTLISVRNLGKRLIMVPRLYSLGEQRNDHQTETCTFVKEYSLAEIATSEEQLIKLLSYIGPRKYEICRLYKNMNLPIPNGKVMAICSYGGHMVELRSVLSFCKDENLIWVSTNSNTDYEVNNFSRWDKWQIIPTFIKLLGIIRKENPNVIISTGAAPGMVGIVVGRILGKHTIWVESLASVKQLSMSGLFVKPFCKEFYTQWKPLAIRKVKYVGNILGL